jgi:hypothetical protein
VRGHSGNKFQIIQKSMAQNYADFIIKKQWIDSPALSREKDKSDI